ncbi:pyrimidine-nucleoside phosphorylase [Ammonifex degensii KC4]|uniref:Pyrimidine-nucleoside phosphorylase n=1 Tax=Ammonifex degensii (strain DSM 10501 / KC4) TaxID=429009 RepID=C9R7Z6_AMMDK|nr:thymidine phosphorylase [Ammonifex degensii]ACX52425.1 pyrimidine-nucleoside phosphorylase [Ammonifex degensii KC4]
MRAYDLIRRKRDGEKLSAEELEWLIFSYLEGEVPDYQMAAWLMAVYFRGLDAEETAHLTGAMVRTGKFLDLSGIPGVKVDKHSTGGVGDKTTLVLAPWLAAAGLKVAKMSGRGLGHTGGTIDKLESIPGFRTELTIEDFLSQLEEVGVAVTSQSFALVPADRKLYALRDVTATVESVPLIAASVMSKKLALRTDALVLDVKVGKGALAKDLKMARELASLMVDIGKRAGRKVRAVISDMEKPLGRAVGNALEVEEAIATLQGNGPEDLVELCLSLGSQLLELAGLAESEKEAREKLRHVWEEGRAWEKFKEWVKAQGGKVEAVEDPSLLPQAPKELVITSPDTGFVEAVDALAIGEAARILGAGRERKGDPIDPAVGVILEAKVGDWVERGAPLARLRVREKGVEEAEALVARAFTFSAQPPPPKPLIHEVVS